MLNGTVGLTQTEAKEEAWMRADVLEAIRLQEQILARALPKLLERAQQVVEMLPIEQVNRVFLVGCGDSYYAGLAARLGFEMHVGLPTDALPSMEFSRYSGRYIDDKSLVFALSNSGRASRSVEAAQVAMHHKAVTVAVTGRPESALAKSANATLLQYVETPDLPLGAGSLGLANYMVTLAALYASMLALGVNRGRLSQAQGAALAAQLTASTKIIGATVDANLASIRAYAAIVENKPVLYILGSGPSLASSYFGAAKMYELPAFEGVPQELEEFAHEQYFMTEAGTQVMLVVPPGASATRAVELVDPIHLRGGQVAIIGDSKDEMLKAQADYWFPIVGEVAEEFSPMYYVVPMQMLADAITQGKGPGYRRNVPEKDEDTWQNIEFKRIYGSQLVVA